MDEKTEETSTSGLNFIEAEVMKDIEEGLNNGRVQTRFPPEPNGYLHIGHAKAICMDFGIAKKFGGVCNLRFDDTNPVKEDVEYVDSIQQDIRWLGYEWANIYYASDYFDKLYDLAIRFIKEGKAYVDEQSAEQIAAQKGSPTVPGTESPFRNRSAQENLALFAQMSEGKVEDGKMVLRAKIDMASPNMHFRDPIMYRIITTHPHHRTGDKWKVYPMYDFAHGQSDYFEGVTHSLCTLEFEVHRPLYEWFLNQFATGDRPKQREFNRLNLSYTVMSKRKMLALVKEGLVSGWDDPRMPTICGLRRRGYTPESILDFVYNKIGFTKYMGLIDMGVLESCVREDLNKRANRVCAVLNPLKLVLTNIPEGQSEAMLMENNPEDPEAGTRSVCMGREVWIERDDFLEDAPKKYYRLTPGAEVRLKGAYIVRCTGCAKDSEGNVSEVYAEVDPLSKSGSGNPESNRKIKGTIHWVDCATALKAEVRLYDRLFNVENPGEDKDRDFHEMLNPDSLKVVSAFVEPSLSSAVPLQHFQFQRVGYFNVDPDSRPGALVFNRTVGLKDSWAKISAKK